MKFLKSFIELIYPRVCPGCGDTLSDRQVSICVSCWSNLPKTYQYRDDENQTVKLFWGKLPLIHGFSTFKYDKRGIL